MKLDDLRKLIKEEVEQALDENPALRGKAQPPPKDFADYRKMFAAALAACGAPSNIVSDADAIDYEGGDVFGRMWESWLEIESEMRGGHTLSPEDWEDLVSYAVRDAVVNIVSGSAQNQVSATELSQAVVDWFLTGKVKKVRIATRQRF